MITNDGEKKLNLFSLEQRRFSFDVLFLYKALNGYINIDLSTFVQFFSDSDRYPLGEKMNVLLKRIMLELIHLSLVFSIGSWTCGHTLPLLVPQATTIASFKKEVREF